MRVMGLIECQVSLTKSAHVARGKNVQQKSGVKYIQEDEWFFSVINWKKVSLATAEHAWYGTVFNLVFQTETFSANEIPPECHIKTG